ncbi:MAG: tyrosine--tRNA ligase [Planctomycetes bacterium]|nr:tyrosine--tRNA ligase [Planctomycetota bacterium]
MSSSPTDLLGTLRERGFVQQVTDEAALRALLGSGRVTAYIGFDPTAPSLHVGHLVQVLMLMHLQRAGHRPVVLVGGGTGRVGDPSGKTEMRQLLDEDAIRHNLEKFRRIFARFLDFEGDRALVVDNADWLLQLHYIEFLRHVGRHFSVNQMLTAEAYKQRLEKGLTFLEFNYQILQAYDFHVLHERHGCRVQMGGSDQWGNICAGVDLVRRMDGAEVYGLTIPLITTSDGKKMGKSEKGAVWIDAELYSPYDFFQYWVNIDDRDVERFLKLFTFLPLEEIRVLTQEGGAALRSAKKRLALEVTELVHGRAEAEKAERAAAALFSGSGADLEGAPVTELRRSELPIGILDLLVRTGLVSSKSDARRLIQQGGAQLGEARLEAIDLAVDASHFSEAELLLRAGKRKFHRVKLVDGGDAR